MCQQRGLVGTPCRSGLCDFLGTPLFSPHLCLSVPVSLAPARDLAASGEHGLSEGGKGDPWAEGGIRPGHRGSGPRLRGAWEV